MRKSMRRVGSGVWSVYWFSDDLRFIALLFAVTLAVDLAFLIGFRTNAMTVAA